MTSGAEALDLLARSLRPGATEPDPALRGLPADRWEAAIAVANRHLLGPALHAALARRGQDGLPPEAQSYLALLHRLNLRRNAVILRQARQLVGALNAAGIEPMLLKGTLMLMAGPRIGRGARMMADIDIAVPSEAADDALATLERLGYGLRERYPEGHHAYGEFARQGDPAAVDLHFELIDHDDVLSASAVRGRAGRVAQAGLVFRVPEPTDRILHNLLHAQIHHIGAYYRAVVDLRQLHEFALLAVAFGSAIDWTAIRARLTHHRLSTPLESWLYLAHGLFGTAWPYVAPPSVRARLHAARCLLHLRRPGLARLAVAPGNLRAGFAWHRMRRLYRDRGGGTLAWRLRHIRQYVARHGVGVGFERLFRSW